MANRDIRIQYVAGDELKNIVELEEESEYEDSDASSVEEEDGISEFSDYARLKNSKKAFLAKMGRVVRLLVLMKTRINK